MNTLVIVKYLITAFVVVAISEIAKRSDQAGALVASLPLVTFMVLIWLHIEQQPIEKLNNHAFLTFWYVISTLPMFLAFPLLNQHYGFWLALLGCVILTIGLFVLWAIIIKPFGINLL